MTEKNDRYLKEKFMNRVKRKSSKYTYALVIYLQQNTVSRFSACLEEESQNVSNYNNLNNCVVNIINQVLEIKLVIFMISRVAVLNTKLL